MSDLAYNEVSLEQLKKDINEGFLYFYHKRGLPIPKISKSFFQFSIYELAALNGNINDRLVSGYSLWDKFENGRRYDR